MRALGAGSAALRRRRHPDRLGTVGKVRLRILGRRAFGAGDHSGRDEACRGTRTTKRWQRSTLEKEGHGAYPVLARMRAATLQAQKGDAAAVAAFNEIGKDVRSAGDARCRLRAGWLLIETGTYDGFAAAEELAFRGNASRFGARGPRLLPPTKPARRQARSGSSRSRR